MFQNKRPRRSRSSSPSTFIDTHLSADVQRGIRSFGVDPDITLTAGREQRNAVSIRPIPSIIFNTECHESIVIPGRPNCILFILNVSVLQRVIHRFKHDGRRPACIAVKQRQRPGIRSGLRPDSLVNDGRPIRQKPTANIQGVKIVVIQLVNLRVVQSLAVVISEIVYICIFNAITSIIICKCNKPKCSIG